MTATSRDIFEYLLPFVGTAGRYTAFIQKGVGTHAAKDGATAFHQALSDGDLTVQSFLEVVLLSRFSMLSFFSEEQAQSLNAKYFAPNAELEVQLDPIDGTRSYIDNRPHYQIIIGVHDREQLVGALCLMPRRDRCYIGLRGEGAFVLSLSDVERGASWQPFQLQYQGGPVLMFGNDALMKKLSPHFETKDIVAAYTSEPGQYNFTDMLEGRAAANLHTPCQAIDGGAMALIAEEAGAVVTDFSGRPLGSYRSSPTRIVPEALVAATPEIHRALLDALRP